MLRTQTSMKTEMREKRNALIRTEVHNLIKQGTPTMQAYADVAERFFLEESTVKRIYNNYGYYH